MVGKDNALALTALITSAAHDEKPEKNLREIYRIIIGDGREADLDALDVLPHLLPCQLDGTEDFLELMGECGSAKEIVIAGQEAVERIEAALSQEEQPEPGQLAFASQLSRLMDLYASAVPRLKLRKSVSETLQPIISELEQLLSSVAPNATIAEGRVLVSSTSNLLKSSEQWAQSNARGDVHEVPRYTAILSSFLDTSLEACADKIASSLAQRIFEGRFPRLVLRSAIRKDWGDGEQAVQAAFEASEALGRTSNVLQSHPTLASLILLAHTHQNKAPEPALLDIMFPVILSCLQANTALDEALAFLLEAFFLTPSSSSPSETSPEIVIPLSTLLPPLCSAHPDPPTRHLTFRLFAQVLRTSPEPLRLQILQDLVSFSEDQFPQMRSSAIGLVKEAVLEALGDNNSTSMFVSPLLLQTIGPHVFRPNPPDLFAAALPPLKDFLESPEPARLIDCLGLYYVVVMRDANNRTGIRDLSSVKSVESSLLGPLRSALGVWLEGSNIPEGHGPVPWALASLQTNIERIDDALKNIL